MPSTWQDMKSWSVLSSISHSSGNNVLMPGPANYMTHGPIPAPWAPVFVNKVLSEYSHAHFKKHNVYSCFHATTAVDRWKQLKQFPSTKRPMFAMAVTFIISHNPHDPSNVIIAGIYCANQSFVLNLVSINLDGKRLQLNFHWSLTESNHSFNYECR